MKEKVIKLLAKWGNNQDNIDSMISANFDYAVKTYPDAKPSFIAEVLINLS